MNSSSLIDLRNSLVYKSFSLHRKFSIYYRYERYLSFYALFLIIAGTIFNLTSFAIMTRKNMQKYACMRYLAILSVVDMLVLYQWNLNTFFKYNLSVPPYYKDLEELSIFWCRWISYFAFSTLQLSSWLLSVVSFDRVMIVYFSFWAKKMHHPAKINLVIALIVCTVLLINSHIIFFNGYVRINKIHDNSTNVTKYEENIVCYKTRSDPRYIFPRWEKVHLMVYNAIPFTIMLVCNSLIIYNVVFAAKVKSHAKGSNKRKRRMSYMLILITFSFILLTLPSVIVHTFLRDYLSNKPYRRLVNSIVNNFLHTSHAINFLLYIYSAPSFRTELMKILANLKHKFARPNKTATTKTIDRTNVTTKLFKAKLHDNTLNYNATIVNKSVGYEAGYNNVDNNYNNDKNNINVKKTEIKFEENQKFVVVIPQELENNHEDDLDDSNSGEKIIMV